MFFDLFYDDMCFRDNLKAELVYSGMLVKELADRAGIKKHTIDQYLSARDRMPSAETAVKIARALGVSAEYLLTGSETEAGRQVSTFSPEVRLLARTAEQLNPEYRKIALSLVQALKNHSS